MKKNETRGDPAVAIIPRARGRAAVRLRELFLRANPLCAECLKRGIVRAAAEVDHVIALFKGGADDESNKQSLCLDCHKTKTAKDKGYYRRAAVGVDGWPDDFDKVTDRGRKS